MERKSKEVKDLEAVLEISNAMMLEKDLDRLLRLIAHKATEVMEAERSSIFIADEDTQELWGRVTEGVDITEIRFPWAKGIAGHVFQTREVVNIKDAYNDPRFNPEIDKKTGYRTRSILCAPLINHKNEVTGALQVLNKKKGVFNEYDESLIMAFSAQVAVALENAQLYLEQEYTFSQFLKTITATLDARDPTTAGHSERVARYALNMARALGFNDEELKTLEYAALLHDVGKIAVRDDVLLKPGRLTPEEYEKMKSHALKTREILENMFTGRNLREIPHIASSHHEKLDGSGYPFGLKNGDMSISAKILAIADIFDALAAEDRPYKKAMPVEEAIAILEKDKGSKFDAELLDLFKNQRLYLIERRKAQRHVLKLPVEFRPYLLVKDKKIAKTNADVIKATTVNISTLGLLMHSPHHLAVGIIISLTIDVPGNKLDLSGRVLRVERLFHPGEYNIAIEFADMPPETLKKLELAVEKGRQ